MRHRSRADDLGFTGLIDCSRPEWLSGYKSSYFSSNSWGPWGNNPGPYRSYDSSIDDNVSPDDCRIRPFNDVRHVSYKAAWIEGRKVVTFPYPTPALAISIAHPFMYRPYFVTSDGPWASMADELASLARGKSDSSCLLAVSLLEAGKTYEMLRNPFNLLKPNFRRSVKKKTARMLAMRGANVWLEGYYGWKSLYQDLGSVAKATAKFLNESTLNTVEQLGERLSVRRKTIDCSNRTSYVLGTSESSWNEASMNGWTLDGLYPSPGNFWRLVGETAETKFTFGCQHFMATEQRIAYTRRFLSAYGLSTWQSIRDTLWEVLPFSFVVDWFIDTRGVWARANQARLGAVDIKNLGYSTLSTGTYGVECYLSPWMMISRYETPWAVQLPSSQGMPTFRSVQKGEYKLYTRNAGYPPDADLPSLCLGKGLTFIRGMNGAALLTQLFSKEKRNHYYTKRIRA